MLVNNSYIKESVLHGYGVFAKDDIQSGNLVEECVCPTEVIEPKYTYLDTEAFINNIDTLQSYRLEPTDGSPYWLMPLGNFGVYNHSFKPNAEVRLRPLSRIVEVTAITDIKKDEEIVWNYGPKYKYNRKNKIK
jgi:SET domain-containing protein